jgi:hypothetical protein
LLLALAKAVIFGSESRGTRDHILLSQIRNFPFRHLLRLAGLPWRSSTLPLHEILTCPFITAPNRRQNTPIQQFVCSSVTICASVFTGTHINSSIIKVLSEALSRECEFPETVAQKWSIPRCCANSEATGGCHRYALSEVLPSNGLLWLSCVRSQYGHGGLFLRR